MSSGSGGGSGSGSGTGSGVLALPSNIDLSGSQSQSARSSVWTGGGSTQRRPVTTNGETARKFPSPYFVTTSQLAFTAGPKHHFVTTHWSQKQPQRQSESAAAGSGGGSGSGGPDGFSASIRASPRAGGGGDGGGGGGGSVFSQSGRSQMEETKTSLPAAYVALLPPPKSVAAANASAAAAAAASARNTAPPPLNPNQVYASGDGGESGVAPPTQKFKSAGKFTSSKRAYRAPPSVVAETGRRLAAETEEYRQRGLKFGSSIQNIAFHQPHVDMKLPSRFASPDFFDRPLRTQHAAYRTTSNQIGHRPPNATELNRVYATRPISFSGSFTAGPYRSGGLNTAIAKPRVDTKESALQLG